MKKFNEKEYKKLFLVFMIIMITLGILKFNELKYFFNDLIAGLILFCISYKLNYQLILFFIIITIIHVAEYIGYIGYYTGTYIIEKKFDNKFMFIVFSITFVFYIIINFFLLNAYRKFKKIENEGMFKQQLIIRQGNNNSNDDSNDNRNGDNNQRAFQGNNFKL